MENFMSDFLLVVWGVLIVGGIALFIYLIERITKCSHKWGHWEFKEDSAVFIQKRQCKKCGYSEIEQHRKVKEKNT
jgi:hypothetical protein